MRPPSSQLGAVWGWNVAVGGSTDQSREHGVSSLRMDVDGGYRVYYAIAGKEIVLLLCGGGKRTQDSDIVRACEYQQDWQMRTDDGT